MRPANEWLCGAALQAGAAFQAAGIRIAFCLLFAFVPLLAQIGPARIGCFIDAREQLREVHGTSGSFIVSEPLRQGVLAALCTDKLTIVKTENEIEVNGLVLAAAPGPASIAPDGLVCYADGNCERFGNATAEAPAPEPVQADGSFLVIGKQRIELPAAVQALDYLGPGWVRVLLADGAQMAFSRERVRVYRLPAAGLSEAEGHKAASGEAEARDAELAALRRARALRLPAQPGGAGR